MAVTCVVGIGICGKVKGVIVDAPDSKRNTAKFVAQMVRQGLRIETWTLEDARGATFCFGCEVCNPKRKGKSLQIEAAL